MFVHFCQSELSKLLMLKLLLVGDDRAWHARKVADPVERKWLTLAEAGEILGEPPGRVRRLLRENALLAVRVDGVLCLPEEFLHEGEPLGDLRGTVFVLRDAGYSDEEAMSWLLSLEPTLGAAPVDALRAGRKTEVRRVAQSLAF